MSIYLLNPEFQQPYFQPDFNKEYICSKGIRSKGFTYLMALVMSGLSRLEEFNLYFQSKSDDPNFLIEINKQNTEGWTALMLASRNSRIDSSDHMVEYLIPKSDHNLQNSHGCTALMYASLWSRQYSSERTVELLIPKSDHNLQDKNGYTALMLASQWSRTDSTERTVELLIPKSNHNLQNIFGCTALISAARNSRRDSTERTVELLIPKSNLNLQTSMGYTALMVALMNINSSTKRTIEILLEATNQVDLNWSYLNNEARHLLFTILMNKYNTLKKHISERETFKECFKNGLSLSEAIITSYI